MSRNSRRTQVTEGPGVPTPTAQPATPPEMSSNTQNNQNAFGLSFVVPTQMVDLPSGGSFYDRNSPLHNSPTVEIKHMTAKEEDILVNEDYIARGILFDKLVDSLLVNKSISSNDLLVGDKNAILIAARTTGYGNEYLMRLHCEDCGKLATFAYDLEKVGIKEINLNELKEQGIEYDPRDSLFRFELPKSNIRVGIRLLTGHDHQFLKKQSEQKTKLGLETNSTIDFLRKIIVEANDVTEAKLLNQLVEVLPAIDSRKVRAVYTSVMPNADTNQKVTCPLCSAESESEVPFTLEFFWPDI